MPVLHKKEIIKCLWVDLLSLTFLGLGEPACFHWNSVSWSRGHSSRSCSHHRSPEHQELRDLNWSPRLSLCPHDRSFFLFFTEHPWEKLRAILLYLQLLANNCVCSSHTDIKLCTYYLWKHTTIFIHEILYFANQHWCSDFLTPQTPLIIIHRLPAFIESLMPLTNWCSIHARWSKRSLKHSIRFCGISFSSLNWMLLHIVFLKCPHTQIALLKFTSRNNQHLVCYIPIATVAVHLNLES